MHVHVYQYICGYAYKCKCLLILQGGLAGSKAAEPKGTYFQQATRNVEGENREDDTEDKKLTGKDLLSFARQIAAGMVYKHMRLIVLHDILFQVFTISCLQIHCSFSAEEPLHHEMRTP